MRDEFVKVKNIRREGGQWFWTVVDEAMGIERHYRTNRHGEGMWCWEPNGVISVTGSKHNPKYEPVYEWRQVLGTCQWSLNNYSISGARGKLTRRFQDWD